MVYAIVDTGGTQIWLEEGKYYDLNYIPSHPGDILNFHRVLFIRTNEKIQIGYPCLEKAKVIVQVLKHLKGRKITVFKMKPKKNSKIKNGYRNKITRVLVQNINIIE
uniref:50S ribosomal protein L21, chloroplastic n=1 Tax=Anotrichium furcellatum TaxID=41999 RepID=A0A4D6WM48_9FLOR|nr:ribosomal protein L21 [Anotrichium furcellatum]